MWLRGNKEEKMNKKSVVTKVKSVVIWVVKKPIIKISFVHNEEKEFLAHCHNLIGSKIKCYFITDDNPKPVERKLTYMGGSFHREGSEIYFDNARLVDESKKESYLAQGKPPFYFKVGQTVAIELVRDIKK
jgi:hypothetical protein